MNFRKLGVEIKNWWRERSLFGHSHDEPVIDSETLLAAQLKTQAAAAPEGENNQVVVKQVGSIDKDLRLDKMQEGLKNLVDQLEQIDGHLSEQVSQNKELTERFREMPRLMESFPVIVENQEYLRSQLFEILKSAEARDQQLLDSVEKMPRETAKQTDILEDINHQLEAAANVDAQFVESFNRFRQSLEKLDKTTTSHAESITQMTRTFATSDRYLKYIISVQNKRLMWLFVIAMSICTLSILFLIVIFFLVYHR